MNDEEFKEGLTWAAFDYLADNFDFDNDGVLEMVCGLFDAGFLKLPDSEKSYDYFRRAFCDQNCFLDHHPNCGSLE